jgi:hypothetical protein
LIVPTAKSDESRSKLASAVDAVNEAVEGRPDEPRPMEPAANAERNLEMIRKQDVSEKNARRKSHHPIPRRQNRP